MRLVTAMILAAVFVGGCATTGGKFEPLEAFPSGEQTNMLIGGFMSGIKDVNTESVTIGAPIAVVWPAVKQATARFGKVGGRAVVAVDEQDNRIQNGRITGDSLIGSGAFAWADEFVTEATALPDGRTTVSVTRKVVENETNAATGTRAWKTQWSNGKVERWILTQVVDAVNSAHP